MQRLLTSTAVALLLGAAAPAQADRYWTFIGGCASADWFGKTNGVNAEGRTTCWAETAGGTSGVSAPTSGDTVYITHSNANADLGNVFSNNAGPPRTGVAYQLRIAGTAGRFASLAVSADTLNISDVLDLGQRSLGAMYQSGGTVTAGLLALGFDAGGVGRYELSGGQLSPLAMLVGYVGTGQFLQTGGTLDTAAVSVWKSGEPVSFAEWTGGTATLSSSLNIGDEELSASGRVRIAGTANVTTPWVEMAKLGRLQLEGGRLAVTHLRFDPSVPLAITFTGGVLEFQGKGSIKDLKSRPAPLVLGSIFGNGDPTLRLAAGATLSMSDLTLGNIGLGLLEFGAGSQLQTTSAILGVGDSLGTAEGRAVVGSGALWSNSGHLAVGGVKGIGRVEVLGGGRLETGSADLGATITPPTVIGNNLVRIDGAGSSWRNTGSVWVGGNPSGPGKTSVLELRNGGSLTVGSALVVQAGSTLLVTAGGLAEAGGVVGLVGSAITLRDGQLRTTGGANFSGTVTVQPGEATHFDGPVAFNGTARLQAEGGEVHFNGPLSFEAGAQWHNDGQLFVLDELRLQPGVVLSGAGTKYLFGPLLPAETYAQFTDPGTLALMDGSVLSVHIGGAAGHSHYTAAALSLGGSLQLRSADGYHGQDGDSFDLLDGLIGGSFATIDTQAFALAPGLTWDFSRLGIDGVVRITTAVPEPGTWLLMLAGGLLLVVVARRSRVRAGARLA